MILAMFTVFDSKAQAYLPPFFVTNAAVAKRSFTQAANDENHDFSRYAGDYSLFELGTFDDSTAQTTLHTAPINLGLAQNYKTNPIAELRHAFDVPKEQAS